MDFAIVGNALGLVGKLGLVITAVIAGAGLCIGIFQVATQISDDVLSFVAKFAALFVLFFIAGSSFVGEVEDFTRQVWSAEAHYH